MFHLKKVSDYKSFVKSFANFGEGFIRNRFTLRTILKLANDSPLGPMKRNCRLNKVNKSSFLKFHLC